MTALAYKPSAEKVFARLRLLHARRAQDRIFAVMDVPSHALAEFQSRYADGFCDYPDPRERIRFWDRLLAERASVEDDAIPSAYLSELDQGLYGGVLGGAAQFLAHPESGWISSMVSPLLNDWSEFDRLRFDPAHPWFQRYLRQLDVFTARAAGKFGVSHFILINGLNFVFELVGATRTYLSLDENPDMVRRALDLALELNVAVQETFFQRVGLLEGGTASNMVQWIPGRVVSESVDPFHMTSVAYFERWGREPVEQVFRRFDGGVLHIHGNGRHLLEAVATIRGLKAIYLGDDKGFPRAIEVLESLRRRTGDLPLVLHAGYREFVERLDRHQLPGGVFFQVSEVPDVAAANRLMDRVRAYRA